GPAHGVHAARLRRGLPAQAHSRLNQSASSPSSSKLRRPYWSGIDPQPQIATGCSGTIPYSSSGSPFSGSTTQRCCQLSPRSKTYSNSSPGLTSLATLSLAWFSETSSGANESSG